MKIHIQVNASPFYHGRALLSYRPLFQWGDSENNYTGLEQETVSLSQRPSFWIDVSKSQGGDIELPFVYHRNWLPLLIPDDLAKMGVLKLSSPGVLKNANSVSGSDVQIIVWGMATDVVLSGTTVRLQSTPHPIGANDKISRSRSARGKSKSKIIKTRNDGDSNASVVSILNQVNNGFKDEYGKGVVSSTASALAEAANVVSSVPVVGPFATATATAASCVAGVADYFGWTNVPNINNVEPVKDQPFAAFASPSISTPVEKLSVDPKNELCVDSRTVGLDGSDELSIESIVTRESYLISTNFHETHSIGRILFCTYVWPSSFRYSDETINSRTYRKQYLTPMALVSRMFRYWRGDISFRFVANKTKYHAGRVLISWDPLADNPTGNNPTETHAAVWDFSQSDEFVFTVPYNQQESWLNTFQPAQSDGEFINVADSSFVNGYPYSNGQITMTVLTKITGPAADANIDILVFVRGCPNLKFNDPIQISKTYTAWRPQSAVESLDTDQIDIDSTVSALSLVTMGEDHISLRPLLHRTNEYVKKAFASDTTSLVKYCNQLYPRMPLIPGFDPSGFHITTDTGAPRYNYIPHSAYTWLAPAFLGMRGSVTYHFNFSCPELSSNMTVARSHGTLSTANFIRFDNIPTGVGDSTLNVHALDNDVDLGMAGMAMTNQKTQSGLSVNMPMYSRFRMIPTMPIGTGDAVTETNTDSFRVFMRVNPAGSGKNANLSYLTTYYNLGPDFNFYFYVNAPIIYCADPPASI
jgi:hypothetical protein